MKFQDRQNSLNVEKVLPVVFWWVERGVEKGLLGRLMACKNGPARGKANVLCCDRGVNHRGGSVCQRCTGKTRVPQCVHVALEKHWKIQKSPRRQRRRPQPWSSHREPKHLEVTEAESRWVVISSWGRGMGRRWSNFQA